MSVFTCLRLGVLSLTAVLAAPALAAADTQISSGGATITLTPFGTAPSVAINSIAVAGGTINFAGTGLAATPPCTGSGTAVSCPAAGVSTISGALTGLPGTGGSFVNGAGLPAGVALQITGGVGRVTVIGGAANDQLTGGNDNDTLLGGGGNDQLAGGNGDDHLAGNNGIDSHSGGAGNDLVGMENNHDADVLLDCGAGNDIVGLDIPEDPNPPAAGCERVAPHITGPSPGPMTITAAPQAGSTFSAAGLSFGALMGTAPDAFDFTWYLCSAAVPTQPGSRGAPVAAGCSAIGTGASVAIPASAGGRYLGVAGTVGLATQAGAIPVGAYYAFDSYMSATARLIAAAPAAPAAPAVTPPGRSGGSGTFSVRSTIRCKSSSCSIRTNATAAGAFTVQQRTVRSRSRKRAKTLVSRTTKTVAAGPATLAVKLTRAAKTRLKKTRKLSVTTTVTFRPTGGSAISRTVKLSYRLKRGR